MYTIDINCDVGEGIGNESELMPYISSCSIASGGHAGNESTIREVVNLALKHNVKIGAHPSFPDIKNFGRHKMAISSNDLQASLEKQILLILTAINAQNTKMNHVKPHGALYNLASIDESYAKVVVAAVKNTAKNAYLYVPYKSIIKNVALENGLKVKVEAFADRNYNTDLSLVSRKQENAVIINKEESTEQLLKIILDQKVKSINGVEVALRAETFCFHGDNPKSIELLKYTSKKLKENNIKMA